jgi:hypothetical protein
MPLPSLFKNMVVHSTKVCVEVPRFLPFFFHFLSAILFDSAEARFGFSGGNLQQLLGERIISRFFRFVICCCSWLADG